MNTPTYNIDRIDGPVVKNVIVTVGTKTQRQSITLLEGQYVTVIVLTNKEHWPQVDPSQGWTITEKWFNP